MNVELLAIVLTIAVTLFIVTNDKNQINSVSDIKSQNFTNFYHQLTFTENV